ncbi:MAG TPA: hypothetical protein VLT86_02030 [Vicinamibacterales bacterium]|nr:hypothetical protein [Vicinamibacterales bacterium]
MVRRTGGVACVMFVAMGLALSAQTAKLVTSWAAPVGAPMSFAGKKVVALALTDSLDVKMSAEEAMAREITARGPNGVAAYRAIPKEELANKDRAQQWFAKTNVAGVVTMRVVNVDTTKEYSSVMFGASYYQSFGSFYDYGVATIVPIGDPKEKKTYAIETLLYDISDGGKLLWAGMSETTDPKNISTFVKGLAKTIGNDLEKKGLVQKK